MRSNEFREMKFFRCPEMISKFENSYIIKIMDLHQHQHQLTL